MLSQNKTRTFRIFQAKKNRWLITLLAISTIHSASFACCCVGKVYNYARQVHQQLVDIQNNETNGWIHVLKEYKAMKEETSIRSQKYFGSSPYKELLSKLIIPENLEGDRKELKSFYDANSRVNYAWNYYRAKRKDEVKRIKQKVSVLTGYSQNNAQTETSLIEVINANNIFYK